MVLDDAKSQEASPPSSSIAYPTQEEITECKSIPDWIDLHFLRSDPFAFKDIGFRGFISLIAKELEIDPNGIFCTGSGAIGLSLNPKNVENGRLRPFNWGSSTKKGSDLDIALISEVFFETAWRDLRKGAEPTLEETNPLLEKHLNWQKKKFFDGAIIANKLLPALSFGPEWIPANVRITEWVARSFGHEVDVNYWIYRDYWSVRNYVASGIVKCRELVA